MTEECGATEEDATDLFGDDAHVGKLLKLASLLARDSVDLRAVFHVARTHDESGERPGGAWLVFQTCLRIWFLLLFSFLVFGRESITTGNMFYFVQGA